MIFLLISTVDAIGVSDGLKVQLVKGEQPGRSVWYWEFGREEEQERGEMRGVRW